MSSENEKREPNVGINIDNYVRVSNSNNNNEDTCNMPPWHPTYQTQPQGTDPLTNSFLGYGYDVDTKDTCTAISQKRLVHLCI